MRVAAARCSWATIRAWNSSLRCSRKGVPTSVAACPRLASRASRWPRTRPSSPARRNCARSGRPEGTVHPRAALALLALLGACTAHAAEERWAIVAKESSATFRVRILGIMPLAGAFAAPSGAIVIDRDARTGSVDAVIRAASVTMSNPENAEWARSPEFFDAVQHPEIRFHSDRFPITLLAEGGE